MSELSMQPDESADDSPHSSSSEIDDYRNESDDDSQDESWSGAAYRLLDAWNDFWFTPARPHTLCVLRILTGAMLLYSHLVLASDLSSFIGTEAWINNEMARQLHDGAFGVQDWARSYLWHVDSPMLLAIHHGVAICFTAMFMLGFATRITAPLALFFQLMILHRLTGALFGFDQIVTYTTMYLAMTPCGACFSIDAWWAKKRGDRGERSAFSRFVFPDDSPTVSANIGTRLLQLHLCVIYLFGGLSKARGETWWDGTAVWYALSNYEYQSLDMTWVSRFPAVISALSNMTLFWEVFYCALIWNRVTRPIVLLIALAVHGSIGLCLGMMTFGMMMIIANGIFLVPGWFQKREQREGDRLVRELREDEDLASEIDSFDTVSEATEAKLERKKIKIRAAAARVKRRYRALKKREEKYEKRVEKLREREAKIKSFVNKRRQRRDQADTPLDDE